MDLSKCKKLVEAKQIIVLDVDEIFLSVTQGKYNKCRRHQLLDKLKVNDAEFNELKHNCGLYNEETLQFFSKMDYSLHRPAFDFSTLFAEFIL